MNNQLLLRDYSTNPLYNIKAVVQATGISPSTLRAWERRYNMCQPQRSESGYRLYSERDIAIIRWLKAQVDAGMSISQAVSWLDTITEEAKSAEEVALPAPHSGGVGLNHMPLALASSGRIAVRDFSSLQRELLEAIITFDEFSADTLLSEAFAMYSVEQVGENIIKPVLYEIGDRWHRGEISITLEHYGSNLLLQRMATLLRAVPNGTGGPLIWVGCAPGELHEIGPMLLTIYLRRRGYRVHYLGQNLSAEDVSREIYRQQPAIVLFSASTINAVHELARLTTLLGENGANHMVVGYGGQIFNKHADLRNNVRGIFMGATAQEAADQVRELLLEA